MLDLLLIGHITRDRIVVPGAETYDATGGAVYYGSLPASLHPISVGVLTKLAAEDRALLTEIEEAGIEVTTLPSAATTTIHNIAKSADFERRRFVIEATADPFRVSDLEGVSARIVHVCPLMRGEFPAAGLSQLAARCEGVGLDVQGFVRERDGEGLRSASWPEMPSALSHLTYLKADQREAEVLTGISAIEPAARKLSSYGPREVVVTHADGVLLLADGEVFTATFDATNRTGRTGRGDTTFATYLARRLTDSPAQALAWAGAVASRKLEHPGPFRGPLPVLSCGKI